jgi:type II secretion system protein H
MRHVEKLQRGMTLIEMLTAVAIVGIIAAISVPNFFSVRKRRELVAAAQELRGVLQQTRALAIARAHNVGVRFTSSGSRWFYSVYEDGDGDGVRNDDIADGTDRLIAPAREVFEGMSICRIGLPPVAVVDPGSGEVIKVGSSPIRFNGSSICAFSMLGAGTPGSVFVTDQSERAAAVRVFGASGRIRIVYLK